MTGTIRSGNLLSRSGLAKESRLGDPEQVAGAPAQRSQAGTTRWRYLWESVKFSAIALVTAVALLLLLERALFDMAAVAAQVPIQGPSPNDKLLLAARYPDTRVLYVGDSRVLTDIHPAIVSEACGCGPGFNAGFSAADLRLTRIMANRLLQKLSPELVVIGVSQWELSDQAQIQVWGPARELVPPWELPGFGVSLDEPEEVREAVESVWRLYKYRDELRAALEPGADTAGREDARRGFIPKRETRRVGEEHLNRDQQRFFADFSVDGTRTEALRALVAELHRRGIRVLLVAPPLYPRFYDRVRDEVALFHSAMEELAAQNGAVFEDLTVSRPIGLTAGNFRDAVHLDEAGASKFSRHLGNLIRSGLGTR
jgi:hypothetical protein